MGRRRDVFRPFGLIHQIGSLAPSFWQIWMRFSCFRRCKSGPNILKESAAGISKRPGPEPPGPERPGPKGTSCPLKILGREGGREGGRDGRRGGGRKQRGGNKNKKKEKKKNFFGNSISKQLASVRKLNRWNQGSYAVETSKRPSEGRGGSGNRNQWL